MNCTVRSGDCEFTIVALNETVWREVVHHYDPETLPDIARMMNGKRSREANGGRTTHVACRWCLTIQPLPWPKPEAKPLPQPQMPIGSHR